MASRLVKLFKLTKVFRCLTGITPTAFNALAAETVRPVELARHKALDRLGRKRAVGGGDVFTLSTADQILAAVIWLHKHPSQTALGVLFGVSAFTARRAVIRCVPVLEKAGKDVMRTPDLGFLKRKQLPDLLRETPGLSQCLGVQPVAVVKTVAEKNAERAGRVLAHRKRMASDCDLSAAVLLRYLRGLGTWCNRKIILQSTPFRRGSTLTAAADVLLSRGEIETVTCKPAALGRGRGRTGTYYRVMPKTGDQT